MIRNSAIQDCCEEEKGRQGSWARELGAQGFVVSLNLKKAQAHNFVSGITDSDAHHPFLSFIQIRRSNLRRHISVLNTHSRTKYTFP